MRSAAAIPEFVRSRRVPAALLVVFIVASCHFGASPQTASPTPGQSSTPNPTVSVQATERVAPAQSVEPTPPASQTVDPYLLVVADGDEVTATGYVIDPKASEPKICHSGMGIGRFASWTPDFSVCWGVLVKGIEASTLPGWSDEYRKTSAATLRGTWRDQAIEVSEVIAYTLPERGHGPGTEFVVTCDPPPGGWLEDRPVNDQGDIEAASIRLQGVIDSHPDLYSGSWTGWIDPGSTHEKHAYVLGTVGDVDAVYAELKPTYPFNLCVVAAEYSAAALERVASRLEQAGEAPEPWIINDAAWLDRVHIDVLVLTRDLAELIGSDAGKVDLNPLVVPLSATSPG